MVNEGQVVDELIVAAPGRIAMSAPKAVTDDVIAISYVAVVPTAGISRVEQAPPLGVKPTAEELPLSGSIETLKT